MSEIYMPHKKVILSSVSFIKLKQLLILSQSILSCMFWRWIKRFIVNYNNLRYYNNSISKTLFYKVLNQI